MTKITRGRPRKEMDLKELEKLVSIGCTDSEIGAWFKMTPRSIQDKRKEEPYKTIFETAHEIAKISLRRVQFQTAMKGNPSLQIHLGKHILGQKESLALSGDKDNPIAMDGEIRIIHVKALDGRPVDDCI